MRRVPQARAALIGSGGGRFREQTCFRHSRKCIHLENNRFASCSNHYIDPAIIPPADRGKSPQGSTLNSLGGDLIKRRGTQILARARGVLGGIVIDALFWPDLDDGQRFTVEYSHSGFTSQNLFFYEHALIMAHRFRESGAPIGNAFHKLNAYTGALAGRFEDHGRLPTDGPTCRCTFDHDKTGGGHTGFEATLLR